MNRRYVSDDEWAFFKWLFVGCGVAAIIAVLAVAALTS